MTNEEEIELTPEEEEILRQHLGVPRPEEKESIAHFLNEVRKAKDTTKVSNLDDIEIAAVRKLQQGVAYFTAMGANLIVNYLKSKAEVILASADSKKGFLVEMAVTSKKETKLKSVEPKKSRWYQRKQEGE